MSQALGDLDRFRSESFEPLSFRERGATVPFTTPLLLNARIRHSTSNRGREMVVTNPSGGRGALILPWGAMPDICTPTLFDRHLWETLEEAEDISPIGIRQDAQRLAAQGLAGRHAALAAKDAQRRDQISQRLMRSLLLESLVMGLMPGSVAREGLASMPAEIFLQHAQNATAQAATRLKMPLAEFVADIEALAIALSGASPLMEGEDARLRDMLEELRRIMDEIADWIAGEDKDSGHVIAAQFIHETGRVTIECAETALVNTETLLTEFGFLILDWKREKENFLHRARGPEWVLDGWKTPMALWRAARPADRRSAIWEMALIAPILPREARAWIGDVKDWREPRRTTQVVRDKADWRNGNSLELVARNEKLIGLSISYENQIAPLAASAGKMAVKIQKTTTEQAGPQRLRIPLAGGDSALPVAHGVKLDAAPLRATTESRKLGNMVENASDTALMKIVAIIDRLSNPDIHQRILGPSLPRLRQLRPPRPASLLRVLFLPLSGALVDPLQWRRQPSAIPRSAISPLMASLRGMLSGEFDLLERELRGKNLDDGAVINRVGRRLWPAVAEGVAKLRPDAAWQAIGIGDRDFDLITTLAGGLWRQAEPIWEAWQRMDGSCTGDFLRQCMTGPAREGRAVFEAALHTLLQRASQPSILCALTEQMPSQVAGIVEQVLESWVSRTLTEIPDSDPAMAVGAAEEILLILEALENAPRGIARPEKRDLIAHRRILDQFCRNSYQELLTTHVVDALQAISADTVDLLAEIEAMARLARRFENIGRRVGAGPRMETLKDRFRLQIQELEQQDIPSALSAMEFARIREIILGGDVAERVLYRHRRQRLNGP